MNENNFEYGVETWVMLGILMYILAVLIILYVRYCVIKRTFCPFSKCGLHATCELNDCRKRLVCRTCGMDPFNGGPLCCRKTHAVNRSCCDEVPTLRCVCFAPNCSYCHLFCCEMSLDYEFETKLVSNPVQNI